MTYEKMSLQQAVQSIKEEHNLTNYKIAKILGLKQQIMVKRYLDGDVKSANAKTAMAIFKNYNILVDTFNTPEELEACYDTL